MGKDMGKDKLPQEAQAWLKKHARELPPEEPEEPRLGGNRLKFVDAEHRRIHNDSRMDRDPAKEKVSEEDERWLYELEHPGKSYDSFLDEIEQNEKYRESKLSPAEHHVLDLLRQGHSQADITRRLRVSRAAVSKHCLAIRKIMGRSVANLFEPLRTGLQNSILNQSQTLQPRRRKRER